MDLYILSQRTDCHTHHEIAERTSEFCPVNFHVNENKVCLNPSNADEIHFETASLKHPIL